MEALDDRVTGPDMEWCYEIVDDVSRTFAITIAELEEPLSREICVGYLLCRVADTIEDANHIPPQEQIGLLELYDSALRADSDVTVLEFLDAVEEWIPDDPNPDWTVVAGADRVIGTYRALPIASQDEIGPWVREMIEGMVEFIDRYESSGGLRIETVDELNEYCWYAAGTVGCLVTGLLRRDKSYEEDCVLHETAPSFGLLLQLVNVAKDVAVDYEEENNVYVPRELLREHDLVPADIADSSKATAFEPVIQAVVEEAEEHIEDAREWLSEMPEGRGNTLSAWAIPFLFAVATLRELGARPAEVIEEGDVKIGREEVANLLQVFSTEEDPSVAHLQERMQRGELRD